MTDTRDAESSIAQSFNQVPTGIRMMTSRMRSVNLERDSDLLSIGPVYMSARVLDAIGRVADAVDDGGRTRAWSLTGPYGSGKSTIALLITDLLGQSSSRRNEAEKLLATANVDLARKITAARDHIAPDGFITAVATARRESVPATLLRALTRGAEQRWPDGTLPRKISTSLRALRRPNAGGAEILAALEALCEEAPVVLVIDEFGKILEHLANQGSSDSANDDVYALQEIAEAGAGPLGLRLFTLTLQHLSFLDYSANSAALQRREWAKVQGRFEDITFTPDPSDSVEFIKQSIAHDELGDSASELVRSYGAASAEAWSRLGLQSVLPANADLFSRLYPLHPLTAAVAPLVAAQVGQNDRSLAGFLVSDTPYTVGRFVSDNAATDVTEASTVRLPQLYDYFFESGRTTMLASAGASRWIEIDLILSEARGLDDQDLQILKAIGLLNLVDASGAMRASAGSVLFALSDPLNDDEVPRKEILARLERLTERGFLVYREFNDEYRIWRGSALDMRARVAEARERCDDHTVVKMLGQLLPAAVVAGRHSQRTGMLRHFITMVSDPSTGTAIDANVNRSADGVLVFHFADHGLPEAVSSLPVVVGMSEKTGAVVDAGREVIALEEILTTGNLDAPALREITERAGQARAQLAAVLAAAFSPSKPWTRWLLLNPSGEETGIDSAPSPMHLEGRSLARIVSEACDIRYKHTPHIRNEMLGRHQLTSQGAKARRELITGMLTQPSSPRLGIIGYGPERAIYDGVLAYLRLHGPTSGVHDSEDMSVEYKFTEPRQEDTLGPAWAALRREITGATTEVPVNALFRLLMAPPFGLKAGIVPVIIAAALIIGRGEIALFEEGTYQPLLSPDLMERLIKAPSRYSVKYSPTTDGQRYLVLERVAEALSIAPAEKHSSPDRRNSALLNVTRELLNQVRGLTAYAANTGRLSQRALAVRKVLISARDPDELLFTTLPHVLSIPLIPVGGTRNDALAAKFARRLTEALTEIRNADQELRAEVTRVLAHEFRLPDDIAAMRSALAARAAGFSVRIGEPELFGFISLALNESLADEEWLDPVVVRIVHAGLPSWSDSHLAQFQSGARRMAGALDRLAHLYEPGLSAAQSARGQVQLVSVTDNDGHEERIIVHLPDTIRKAASLLADEVADIADERLGADGRRILLAALASSLAVSKEHS